VLVVVLEILKKAEEFRDSVSKIAYDIERELNDVRAYWAIMLCLSSFYQENYLEHTILYH